MAIGIGIDLGTTYSCVAVMRNGAVEVIANDMGGRTTPSYVAFKNGERLIGDAAKNVAASQPKDTLFDVKRIIGRTMDDASLKADMALWPFEVVASDSGPCMAVTHKSERKVFTPQEISGALLGKLRDMASEYLGESVTDAVITVPAYFNDAQRAATRDAGKIAGLNVKRVINEPTAAALAYGLNQRSQQPKTVLVYDLGGGTFDVSLLKLKGGMHAVVSTAGDTHLGGEDFDQKLMEWAAKEAERTLGSDPLKNARSSRRLRSACEKVKRQLSASSSATLDVESLIDGTDFQLPVSRARFEALCAPLFSATLEPVKRVLSDAKIDAGGVDEVLLVGGSTRIPKIQQLLKDFFKKEPLKTVNPDEAVAIGAAVQASILDKGADAASKQKTADILLVDVTPLSLGVETHGGVMSTLIPRNTRIPTSAQQLYSTVEDNQDHVDVAIYEGERAETKNNNKLGEFRLEGITPMPRGQPRIQVSFDVDASGIITVGASESSSQQKKQLTVRNDGARLTAAQIEAMLKDAKKFAAEDDAFKRVRELRNKVEQQALINGDEEIQSFLIENPNASEEQLQRLLTE